jgi:hypothetical protein
VFSLGVLLFNKQVISVCEAGRGIRDRFPRTVARNSWPVLPIWRAKRVRVLRRVGVLLIGLAGDDKIVPDSGRRKECRQWPDPKVALNGETEKRPVVRVKNMIA